MTELVVATLKFSIRYPHGKAITLAQQPLIDVTPEPYQELIRARSECAHPKFPLQTIADAVHSVSQAAIAVRVLLDMPWLDGGERIWIQSRRTPRRRARRGLALDACRGVLHVHREEFASRSRGGAWANLNRYRGTRCHGGEVGEGIGLLITRRFCCRWGVFELQWERSDEGDSANKDGGTLSLRSSTMLLRGVGRLGA